MIKKKKTITKEAALLRMADLCARAEHCSHEIREKLRKLQLPASACEEIVNYLETNRYVDDTRFARAFSCDKVRFSGWGRNKIRMALALKRIPSPDIREAMEEIDPEEYESAALRAARAKARSLNLADYDDRMKLFRHLASRGFESSLISQIIPRLREEADEAE